MAPGSGCAPGGGDRHRIGRRRPAPHGPGRISAQAAGEPRQQCARTTTLLCPGGLGLLLPRHRQTVGCCSCALLGRNAGGHHRNRPAPWPSRSGPPPNEEAYLLDYVQRLVPPQDTPRQVKAARWAGAAAPLLPCPKQSAEAAAARRGWCGSTRWSGLSLRSDQREGRQVETHLPHAMAIDALAVVGPEQSRPALGVACRRSDPGCPSDPAAAPPMLAARANKAQQASLGGPPGGATWISPAMPGGPAVLACRRLYVSI